MIVNFKFEPQEFVAITVFGNKIPSRIARCITDNGEALMYDIEYMDNSDFKRRAFYEGELEARC